MLQEKRRNVLAPWYIGIAIVFLCDLWIVYRMFAESCPAPALPEFLVVVAIPVVYLALMYLTLKS